MIKRLPPPGDNDQYTLVPYWVDECGHGLECYVCSFTVPFHPGQKIQRYDLHLFPQKFHGLEVCLRYGNEPHEYISPGGLGDFLVTAGINWSGQRPYYTAAQILRDKGVFDWSPRERTA